VVWEAFRLVVFSMFRPAIERHRDLLEAVVAGP